MADKRWSDAQAQAIRERDRPVLVSAGAGSGKTSVLVERVLRRVLDEGIDLDRILIVTFTEAAAGEMKERIARALRERAVTDRNRRARRQLHILPSANIATLHGFCLQVIRAGALELPVDPGFRVAEPEEVEWVRERVLDELLEHWFAVDDPGVKDALARLGGHFGEERLRKAMVSLHDFARSQPHPELWLRDKADSLLKDACGSLSNAGFAAPFFSGLAIRLHEALSAVIKAIDFALAPGGPSLYAPILEQDARLLRDAVEALANQDLEQARTILAMGFASLPRVSEVDERLKEGVQKARGRAKEIAKNLAAGFLERAEDDIMGDLKQAAVWVRVWVDVAIDFLARFRAAREQRGIVDFADLEHLAFAVLSAEGSSGKLAALFAERFEEIMVDEYQDTSPIQDALLSALARSDGHNLFQVGDVKQSIYRFRMAEPGLFLAKRHLYCERKSGLTIDMNENFRSRPEVIDAVNELFGQLFAPVLGGLTYDEGQRMKPGYSYPDAGAASGLAGPVELHLVEAGSWPQGGDELLEYDEGDGDGKVGEYADGEEDGPRAASAVARIERLDEMNRLSRQAHVMARRIQELMREEAQVYDAREERYRPLCWRDIVVLLRSQKGRTGDLTRVFRSFGIPCFAESSSGLYDGIDMRLAFSLLQIIDNPRQDIPLASVLRSAVGGFSSTDLARIRTRKDGDFFGALLAVARSNMDPVLEAVERTLAMRAAKFLEILERWRERARISSTADTVEAVLRESGVMQYAKGLPDAAARTANLETLVRRAEGFDEVHGGGFGDFVRYLEDQRRRTQDVEAAATGEQDDVVRIMTVHKSKGLEFPVVFVADLGSAFQVRSQPDVAFHRTVGFGPRFVDLLRRQRWETAAFVAVESQERRESLAEEARILYVALTRARERLILVGAQRKVTEQMQTWMRAGQRSGASSAEPLPDPVLLEAKNFLGWIGPAVYRAGGWASSHFSVKVWNDAFEMADLATPEGARGTAAENGRARFGWEGQETGNLSSVEWPLDATRTAMREQLREELLESVWVPRELGSGLPAKLTVTEWKDLSSAPVRRAEGDDGAPGEALTRTGRGRGARSFLRPRFVSAARELSATERGTAFHRALQKIDLSASLIDPKVVTTELDRLRAVGLLRDEQRAAVSADDIADFFGSPLGGMILAAGERARRELPFTVALPAQRLWQTLAQRGLSFGSTPPDPSQEIIVQGIADCVLFFEDGLILVDYKTDRGGGTLTGLARRYEAQVELYRLALRQAFAAPVKAAYLYFVEARSAVRMDGDLS